MEMEKFEEQLKKSLLCAVKGINPSRESLSRALFDSNVQSPYVTKSPYVRSNVWTATSKIISNNKLADAVAVWKSKRIILVPSLVLLLLVGTFSLSTHSSAESQIQSLAEQNEQIEEPGIDDDDQMILSSFEDPAVNDLSATNYEFKS